MISQALIFSGTVALLFSLTWLFTLAVEAWNNRNK